MQAPQGKFSMLEEPSPSSCWGLAHRADLVVIDVGKTTTRDGHASTSKPSITFVVKLVTSHLSVEETQERKRLILEVETRAAK